MVNNVKKRNQSTLSHSESLSPSQNSLLYKSAYQWAVQTFLSVCGVHVSVMCVRVGCVYASVHLPELIEQGLSLADGVDGRVGRRLFLLVELRDQLLSSLYRIGDLTAP